MERRQQEESACRPACIWFLRPQVRCVLGLACMGFCGVSVYLGYLSLLSMVGGTGVYMFCLMVGVRSFLSMGVGVMVRLSALGTFRDSDRWSMP